MADTFNVNVTSEGNGAVVQAGNTIKAHYTGTLKSNNKKFDSSHDRNEPLSFKVGAGQVIKGWDQGFVGLKVGTKAIITCPPDYAYGDAGVGNGLIPGGATLIFDVEVVEIVG